MRVKADFILSLADASARLSQVGGKGASLARLAAAGLPVPPGFHITTAAYCRFVAEYGLQEQILAAVSTATSDQPATLEEASSQIGKLFAQHAMPDDIAEAIRQAYAGLGEGDVPVAVRSSATAEDLPEMSFAGQQETYLNIRGGEAVLDAVKRCWASLWTARAIAYRIKNNIDQSTVTLAVVVQEMVNAEAAGILFTVNPINGRRDEMVINAAWGLGEAIVGGLVSPDTIIAEKTTGKIKKLDVTEKTVITVLTESGTEEKPLDDTRHKSQVLKETQVVELASIARRIEDFYGSPQDIEWCHANGNFYIVQSRPITALPEPPLEWKSSYPQSLLMRGSSMDLLPDVVSPLFATLGMSVITKAYERVYAEVMGLGEEDVPVFEVLNGYVYLCFIKGNRAAYYAWLHARTAGKMFAFGKVLALEAQAKCATIVSKWQQMDLDKVGTPELLAGARELFEISGEFLTACVARPIPLANFSEMEFSLFYNTLIKRKEDPAATTFLLGLENVPLRAEKSLFDLAQWIKTRSELADYLARASAEQVWAELQSDPVPAPLDGEFATRFMAHLAEFGHFTYDIDFMNPVPADFPIPMLDTLKVYLAGQGNDPCTRQQAQEMQSKQAEEAICQRVGTLHRKGFQKLLRLAQEYAVDRENAIANIGLPYPQLRRLLRELGQRLTTGGAIAEPEDIYWLEAKDVDALVAVLETGKPLSNHAANVETRKAEWQRARRAVPPAVLPEGGWLAKMMAPKKSLPNTLKGKGTSAGKVTAPACVLRGPEDFGQMRPGGVLVAVTTTPAWTPLFAMASAVVTDIGGPLSHSSIVAREYGIPAVMGTGVATRRICTGQMIMVDGNAGTVTLKV